jgi:methyl-accepting chemotaxis protein
MKEVTVRARLGCAFGALVLALVAVAALAALGTAQLLSALSRINTNEVRPLNELTEVSALTQRNRVLVMDMLLRPDPANVAKRETELKANVERIDKAWGSFTASELTPEQKKIADAFVAARTPYVRHGLRATTEHLRAGKVDEAMKSYRDGISTLAPPVAEALNRLAESKVQSAEASVAAAAALGTQIKTLAMIAGVASVLIGLALAVWLTRWLMRQLGGEPAQAMSTARRIAEGDMSATVVTRDGDRHSLMAAMRDMQIALTRVVAEVRGNAESVATASAQIAQGNADLSQRTEEQASALEETAATMNQLGSTVKNNADNARQADQLAKSASEVAQQGGAVVGEVVETMKGINDSSKKIAEIISVIDGIAFQTNILALNAAVEAARAGEQGRGFAVVAGEVRSLAQRSAEAAKEIKSLIGASVERVEQGSALVDKAGATMSEVVASIRRVTDIVGEITSASNEQATGVNQVGEAITQMDQVTQQNAALVEQSAAAAESLKGQASQLVNAVSVFKLSAGTSNAARSSPAPAAEAAAPARYLIQRAAAKGKSAKPAAPAPAATATTNQGDRTSF